MCPNKSAKTSRTIDHLAEINLVCVQSMRLECFEISSRRQALLTESFHGVSQSSRKIQIYYQKLAYCHFVPYPFHFIIH